jgi:spermidine synthase
MSTPPDAPRDDTRFFALVPLLFLSGVAALLCEVLWMRRLALTVGSTGVAATLTLAVYMAGLGLGGAWAGRRRWVRPPSGYGLLEIGAAAWTLAFPYLLDVAARVPSFWPGLLGDAAATALVLLPPAFLHGGTLPAASALLVARRQGSGLYAANTLGAMVGVLIGPFALMPLAGLRVTEVVAACCAAGAGLAAQAVAGVFPPAPGAAAPGWALVGQLDVDGPVDAGERPVDTSGFGAGSSSRPSQRFPMALWAAAAGGACGMALEVAWNRLASLLLGGSVYALALVLAVFLAGVGAGAAWGARHGRRLLAPALLALGALAALGTTVYGFLPHVLGGAWALCGEDCTSWAGALVLAIAMGGAPVASGAVFAAAIDAVGESPARAAGRVLAANTLGGVAGAALAGLWGLPWLGVRGVVLTAALLAAATGAAVAHRPLRAGLVLVGVAFCWLLSPGWDSALYSLGFYLRVDEFHDLSPRAVDRFAHEGWDLRFYEDGRTATVAVGESRKTGNLWMSVNGKVDASTGRDMPTQVMSGRLPVALLRGRRAGGDVFSANGLVVGLASGVTAGEALAEGATDLTVVEIEPEVVAASRLFDHFNHSVLSDSRTHLVLGDARSWLGRSASSQAARSFDFIVSEPSNPWITGVSNLFTREYWLVGRRHLAPDGVFVQWLQLYSLPPQAMESLIRTFVHVFPRTWLFETIPGADALLVGCEGPLTELPAGLPLEPDLGPEDLLALAAGGMTENEGPAGRGPSAGRLNTDDRPWIEFEAPKWLHRSTGEANAALLHKAAARHREGASGGGDPSR